MQNPLLNFSELPFYNSIRTEHALPALEKILQESREKIAQLEKLDTATWENFAEIMEDIDERIERVWSPISHLNSVMDHPELRESYQQGIQLLTEYQSEIGQNENLYKLYKQIAKQSEFKALSSARQKIINNNLRDFKLSGAELNSKDKQRFREISQQLSLLGNQFSKNILDATQAWSLHITEKEKLSGIPQDVVEIAASEAKQADKKGWLLNLNIPCYLPIMQHADNRWLREQMYYAYATKASEIGPNANEFDNGPLIEEILQLKSEQAALLGYDNYAEISLVDKMANSPDEVIDFLNLLASKAKPIAEKELADLQNFAKNEYGVEEIASWDIAYYSEKQKQKLFDFSDEQIKPFFPAKQVIDGMFGIIERLFSIKLNENAEMETWHKDVKCYDVIDKNGQLTGQFYADLYVRKNKRSGAWMNTCIHRRIKNKSLQQPVAYLVCNFTPPINNRPSLLTHDEVQTLFHEFGHTLHHLLTKVDEMSVAGINGVAWDAVELPSQFLENWCWQKEALETIGRHHQTEQIIPDELLKKMHAAKNFQSGMQTVRQIEFALFDMLLHNQTPVNVQSLLDDVRKQVAVIIPPDYHRFQNSFSHIFAGGYAAGYYSYKWSEVLSADAFSRFEEEGIFNKQTGHDFLTAILQRGGVEDASDLFIEFRGRKASNEALLRHSGLIQNNNSSASEMRS